ncbi:MAG TPA: hypothetical protein VH092_26765, partial [Urbifossiella sp.]|nr:hypothetical protein [Urbifossiella sp.]
MTAPSPIALAEAIRTPAVAFGDPDLAAADPVLGSDGFPLAHAGDRAVVFQLFGRDERAWAVKCFAAAGPDLADRYSRVAAEVRRGRLPFLVPCRFLETGVRVSNRAYPVAVLDWVEGIPLDRAVSERTADPTAVHQLLLGWLRLAAGLRAARVAHGELAHANVLVVPGPDPLRLVDYDSFHFPGLPPTADLGHPNYRHPGEAAPAHRDRFPFLVGATALRAVTVLGRTVWDRYDTGDNLIFTAADFRDPAASPLFQELSRAVDPALRTLAGALARSCARPAAETPWADELCPDLVPAGDDLPIAAEAAEAPPPARKRNRRPVALAALAGVLLLGAAVAGAALTGAFSRRVETADTGTQPPPAGPAKTDPPRATPPAQAKPPAVKAEPDIPESPPGSGFQKVWAVKLTDDRPVLSVHLSGDGRTAFVQRSDRIETFDTKAGAAIKTLRGPGLPTEAARIWSGPPGQILVYGYPLPAPTAWNPRTGTRHEDPIPGVLAPPGPRGAGPDWCEFSPGGRYVFGGNVGKFDKTYHPAAYQLTEIEGKRAASAGHFFGGGSARFAGHDRVLVAGATGELRWVRSWDGQTEI